MAREVTVLVGTSKGAFLLRGGGDRSGWDLSGPHCDLWPINHVVADPDSGQLWAAGGSAFSGAGVWRSADGGATWQLSLFANGRMDEWLTADPSMEAFIGRPAYPPAPFTGKVEVLWSLGRSGGTLYAGAKPAALYASRDGGATWAEVEGLAAHPSRGDWQPGGAGLVLHSIVADPADPDRLWVGISAAGVFATEDGGATWDRRNRLSNAPEAAPHVEHAGHDHHETGLCVHNIVRAEGAGVGDLMYQQNHHGVFRSPDGGRSWQAIGEGLPSTFGFPVAVDPADPATLWVIPLMEMDGRYPPGAAAAVWRSRDGGQSWQPQRDGLPQRNCFFTVLRQAMAVDRATPTGVYFGTNSGSVFASRDGGTTWDEIARHLPTVLSVETMTRH